MTYELPYRGNLTWLRERTILFARHGSHAFGTNIEGSDEDFKGIAIPPKDYFFGFQHVFEQAEGKDPDCVIYDLRKFMRLAADCNPSIVEVLYVDEADLLLCTDAGHRLREARSLFLSRKAKHTFSGYATSQLKRIRLHRRWLMNPPPAPATRAEMGLPETTVISADQLATAQVAITKKLGEWQLDGVDGLDPASRILVQTKMAEALAEMKLSSDDAWRGAARTIGYDENFIRLLYQEREYTNRKREWEQFQNWKATRNVKRAGDEAKFGYDPKHAMHLVRLMRMCREILTTGQVVVKRPDREELLAIRAGASSYEKLIEWAEREDAELEEVAKTSPLPRAPDRVALDRLCAELVESSLR